MTSEVIQVDPCWLQELASRVEAVKRELERAASVFDENDAAVGHALVADALASFDDSWSRKRGELVESLGDAARLLRTAADEFSSSDRELAQGLGPARGGTVAPRR